MKILPPESTEDLMRTNFWYHPQVGHNGRGDPKKFNSELWNGLWNHGVRVFGDIWNPKTNKPLIPNTIRSPSKTVQAVKRLVDYAIPESWTENLSDIFWNNNPNAADRRRKNPRKEYEFDKIPLDKVRFRTAYKSILKQNQKETNFLERTEGPIQAYRRIFREDGVTPPQLWKAARNKFGHPKVGDLLWRLLHDMVMTGTDLEWIPLPQQLCPIHHIGFTKQHIWLECSVAKEVWDEFEDVYDRLTIEEARIPTTMAELKVLMAVGPPMSDAFSEEELCLLSETEKEDEKRKLEIHRRRWHILFPMVVWAIWKAYLTHSHNASTKLWREDTARDLYQQMIRKHIGTDRTLCRY